jgi:hypothetical protein
MRLHPAHLVLVPALLALASLSSCGNRDDVSLTRSSSRSSTSKLESLHRGELSAIATYHQAIEKEGSAAGDLSSIQRDHEDASRRLAERIRELGGKVDLDGGVWSGFAQAVEGTAKVFGNKSAMEILKVGEEHGVRDYEDALKDSNVDETSKDLIQKTLLPRQREHVSMLGALIAAK